MREGENKRSLTWIITVIVQLSTQFRPVMVVECMFPVENDKRKNISIDALAR